MSPMHVTLKAGLIIKENHDRDISWILDWGSPFAKSIRLRNAKEIRLNLYKPKSFFAERGKA